jgi:hypothetical protein
MSHNIGANTSLIERMVVAIHALQSLAALDENARKSLEYVKQEVAMQFEIVIDTGGKSAKEISARRNVIAKSLWLAKTNSIITQSFPMDIE